MLYEIFDSLKQALGDEHFTNRVDEEIIGNLNPKFKLREYQQEALGRFDFYFNGFRQRKHPAHLLFHMATGSGKTIIMAANMLQLYRMGYRHFVFFVNSTNIIEKTRNNFLNPLSNKYLFANQIKFGPRAVQIRELENFEAAHPDEINIVFTTIQGLHTRLNNPRENALTYEDFENKEIVLLSDEAHHINTITKSRLNKGEREEWHSWEGTVERIFNANPKNILLEFTATIDLSHLAINEKYEDKIIFQYDLKHFRLDGYSKEIEVLETDREPLERALQAVLVSQYRRKIAEKHGIPLKPVILFKANYVNPPSKPNPNAVVSSEFKAQFLEAIRTLEKNDIEKFRESDSKIIKKVFAYFDENQISIENIIRELQIDFNEARCLSVDSSEDKNINQVLVNSLEDHDNEIRAVFAVEMLNEGWDVLNLFDIVRLYNTRDADNNRPGKTTIAEAQLIGRGARYYPFVLNNMDNLYQRKFDEDAENELRVLEQLYYHSAHNPRYIQELKTALTKMGIIPEKYIELPLKIKNEFKKTEFWNKGIVFTNERVENQREAIKSLEDANIHKDHEYHLWTGETHEETLLSNKLTLQTQTSRVTKKFKLSDFGKHVVRSAMDRLDFYRLSWLKRYFPNLESHLQFIESKDYLGGVNVNVSGQEQVIYNLTQDQKLNISISVLRKIADEAENNTPEYTGTKTFKAQMLKAVFKDKVIKIAKDSPRAQSAVELNLAAKTWYAQNELYGTGEEKDFIEFLETAMTELNKKYHEIALLRNERMLAIYDFDEGRRFEPDFLLLLKSRSSGKIIAHQVFIEPKGNQFKDHMGGFDKSKEGWKQKFLLEVESNVDTDLKLENTKFRLLGLPFYNKSLQSVFEEAFEEKLM